MFNNVNFFGYIIAYLFYELMKKDLLFTNNLLARLFAKALKLKQSRLQSLHLKNKSLNPLIKF